MRKLPTMTLAALALVATAGLWVLCGVPEVAWASLIFAVYIAYLDFDKLEIRGAEDGLLYLTRYHLIRTKWFKVFLHRIHKEDADRHMHNHPWPRAFSVILRGGYGEHVKVGRRTCIYWYRAPSIAYQAFREGRYHRIVRVRKNTWTLFFAGPRTRDWGFDTPEGHVDWRTYLNLPADAELKD